MNEYKVVVSKQVEEFLLEIEESARTKFIKAVSKVELGLRGVHFLKLSGTNNIFKFRVQDSGKWYRILAYSIRLETGFAFQTTHGFQKKANKTPKKEIDKAERIKKEEQ
jgi:phage-related protein